jgi:glycosyltransferase involved in cell wall biosynthesis
MTESPTIRVLIVAPGPESEGGIRSVIAAIYPRLQTEDGVDVRWIATHRTGSALSRICCFVKGFVQACLRFPGADVVHIHGAVGTSLLRKTLFIWLARLCRCKVIYHFHATESVFDDFFRAHRLVASYARFTLRRCHRLVVLSDTWERIVRAELPGAPASVIYNPVMDVAAFARSRSLEPPVVLYLAHLIERKGYRDLISAFARVRDRVPHARLVFCGTGELEKARALSEKLGVADGVEFKGWVSGEQKLAQLARATVFSLPSYDEGLPMGILECMSLRVPVVATPVGGIPDVLAHDGNALLAPAGDIECLAQCLVRLLTDEALRDRLSQRALEDSAAFHPDHITREWLGLYRDLTGRPVGRASSLAGFGRQ